MSDRQTKKNQVVTQQNKKKSNCFKTHLKFEGKKLKTQIVRKLKNLNCEKIQKLKLWQNSTQMWAKLYKTNGELPQKLDWWQDSKAQIVTELKKYSLPKIYFWLFFLSVKNNFTPRKPMRLQKASFCDLAIFSYVGTLWLFTPSI